MLEFKSVSFGYEDKNILENLSFKVEDGEFVSIIGKSGCGKSTIFRLICKFEEDYEGEILTGNSSKIGYMPQKGLLFPWASVRKNLSLPLEIQKVSRKEIDERIESILNDMELLEYIDKYPNELSGGIRQRIAFARTILTGAEILLLDEPFSALDFLTRLELQEWTLKQWAKFKKTIIFITHNVDEAIFMSNRVLLSVGRPLSSLEVTEIDLPYPRSLDMLEERSILDKKKVLLRSLRDEEDIK